MTKKPKWPTTNKNTQLFKCEQFWNGKKLKQFWTHYICWLLNRCISKHSSSSNSNSPDLHSSIVQRLKECFLTGPKRRPSSFNLSDNVCVDGRIFSRPWVCRPCWNQPNKNQHVVGHTTQPSFVFTWSWCHQAAILQGGGRWVIHGFTVEFL